MNFLNAPVVPGRRPLVLWSGGADSTYLMLQHFRAGQAIDMIAVDCNQSLDKIRRELYARLAIANCYREQAVQDTASESLTHRAAIAAAMDMLLTSK